MNRTSDAPNVGLRSQIKVFALLALLLGLGLSVSVAVAGIPADDTKGQASGQPGTIKNTLGEGALSSGPATGASKVGSEWEVDAPITFILDDGSHEDSIGLTANWPAIWLNRFSPTNTDFPLQLTQISILFPDPAQAGADLTGLAVDLLVYVDADRDNNPANAVKMAQLARTVQVANGTSFSNYAVNIVLPTAGDVYIGFSNTYSNGQPPMTFPAAIDTTASQQRSWAIAATGAPPNYNNLGANSLIILIDNAGFPGNWAIRAAGETQCAITFTDVPPGHTFYGSIRCLVCGDIVSGYADGTFRPNNPVTRGQLAKMVSSAAGYNEPVSGQTFEDVPAAHTFYQWIQRLSARGIMSGYPCTPGSPVEPCVAPTNRPYFRPGANATRGQTAKIVSSAAGFVEPVFGQSFEDVPPTYTFYEWIQRLATRGVMSGYPCGGPGEPCVVPTNRPYFRPHLDVTRGQSSKIVANAFFPTCNP